ncbi:MAG: GNAT family N-acetyltransferase [Burkholderiales bacterium]
MTSVRIRLAARSDREGIRAVHLRAFPEGEGRLVANLASDLLDEETQPETIALVAETGGGVVGHIAFSPVTADTRGDWRGYILAPLGVLPEHHGAGIGSMLVEGGIELLSGKMAGVVLVYGDPRYYGRFGFSAEAAAGFVPPYALRHPFGWQARVLHGAGPNGRVVRISCVRPLRDPALW